MGRDGSGVRAASASTIEITFTFRGRRCRERLQLKPTAANLRRAEVHRAAILEAIAAGTFDYAVTFPDSKHATLFSPESAAPTLTLGVYLAKWIDRVEPSLKSSTHATHTRIVARLIDGIGTHPLDKLRWVHVREWAEAQGVGDKTARNLLSVLRSALKDALHDDLIQEDPLAGRTLRKTETGPRHDEIDPFSSEERAAIIAAADGQERNLIQFGFWTGMRISEIVALEWRDIDWLREVARITRAKTQDADAAESPKTAAGTRDVRLLAPALEALKAQRAHTELMGGAIFRNPRTGEPWPGDLTFRQGAWTRILRKAGVRYRYPYQMRHTYASMLLMAGEPAQWVAAQLGHKDPSFTLRTYARWIASDAPDSGSRAVDMWAKEDKEAGIHAGITTRSSDTNKHLK
jgi:integrase